METIVAAGIGAFIASVSGLITLLLQRKWNKKDKAEAVAAAIKEKAENKDDAVKDALKVMMLDRVQWLGHSYIKEDCVDVNDRRRLHEMHDCYKKLGGDGDLDLIMKEVDDLKLKRR